MNKHHELQNTAATVPNALHTQLVASNALTDRDKSDLLGLAAQASAREYGNIFHIAGAVNASVELGSQPVSWLLQKHLGKLCFAAPVVKVRSPFGSFVRVWTHDYAPLGTPLTGPQFNADQLLISLELDGYGAFVVPYLNMKSNFAHDLVGAAPNNFTSAIHSRACLEENWRAEDVFSKKRLKEMGRLKRRFGFEHVVLRKHAAAGIGFDAFCELESLGWKGTGGTAMRQDLKAMVYAKTLIADHVAQDSVVVDCLKHGEKFVATLISFVQNNRGVIWKIAHDPAYDAVSPGRQVILAATQRLIQNGAELHIDSLATPDHPLINRLWPHQVPMADLIVPTGSSSLLASTLSLHYKSSGWARQTARELRNRLRS